jgi:RNA polymerase sigma factor (sigma-70 family)
MRGNRDAQLLARADRDADAFRAFYRRHEYAVVAYIGRMARDPDLTIEVVAETFARAYESRTSFQDTAGSGRAWVLGIARHVLFAAWRAGSVDTAMRERLGMQARLVSEDSRNAVEQAVLESEHTVVDAWLADLPPAQREAVRRRVLEDDDYATIAQDLSCSEAVVRQRVSRGLSALRRGMPEEER